MTDEKLAQLLLTRLAPVGNNEVSILQITTFIEWELLKVCIREIQNLKLKAKFGYQATMLEGLAIYLLACTANIKHVETEE
jgi:hypothetical protein